MVVFPNAKINIGLNIVEKRPDGFHNIESIFYPINLHDSLEITERAGTGKISFHSDGIDIPGSEESNLCIKVYKLLHEKFDLPSIDCHLLKAIPIGAGLGGGSSDGAFMMKILNDYFNLGMSNDEMQQLIKAIGSDCPFFISNQASLVKGIGDEIESINIDLKGCGIIIVNPNIHISTQEAYDGVVPEKSNFDIRQISTLKRKEWKSLLKNDFESSVFLIHPIINNIKEKLYSSGAFYSSMTGSGSSVYGVFKTSEIPEVSFDNCFVWKGVL